jgi:hypothetical protein
MVFSSVLGERTHLFRVELATPTKRYQLTSGDTNDRDAVYSPDGLRVYYTRDKDGIENIVGLDLKSGAIRQFTNVVTGCFMPTVLSEPDGSDRLVYSGFWNGRWDMYTIEGMEPVIADEPTALAEAPRGSPAVAGVRARHQGDARPSEPGEDQGLQVLPRGRRRRGGRQQRPDLLLRHLPVVQRPARQPPHHGAVQLDRQLLELRGAVPRHVAPDAWQGRVFDYRQFFIAEDQSTGQLERGRAAYTLTGAAGAIIYPLDIYHRFTAELAGLVRDVEFQSFESNINGEFVPIVLPRKDTTRSSPSP